MGRSMCLLMQLSEVFHNRILNTGTGSQIQQRFSREVGDLSRNTLGVEKDGGQIDSLQEHGLLEGVAML